MSDGDLRDDSRQRVTVHPMSDYIPDPSTEDQLLDADEVEALLAGKLRKFAGDKRKVRHFLRRTLATLQAYRQEIQHLHRQVQEINLRSQVGGTPTTLDPRDALRFLPEQELVSLVDGHLRTRVQAVEQEAAEYKAARQQLASDINRFKFAANSLLDDPNVPAGAKDQIRRAMERSPEADELPQTRRGQQEQAERQRAQETHNQQPPPAASDSQPDNHPPSDTTPPDNDTGSSGGLDDLFS